MKAKTLFIIFFSTIFMFCGCEKKVDELLFLFVYNGNGNTSGTAPKDLIKYKEGETVTIIEIDENFIKTGYSFVSWNTKSDGSGTDYNEGSSIKMGNSDLTLYAKWTENPTYKIIYNGNGNSGGAVPEDNKNYEQGDTVIVLANTGNLTRTGYTFIGWDIAVDGSGEDYMVGTTFIMGNSNVTLYAHWSQNQTHTVTYCGNGSESGNVPVDLNNYETGQNVTVLGNSGSLLRAGYSFVGWNTLANGTGTDYAGGATFPMGNSNVTLYAKWLSIPTFTISYNGNGLTHGTIPVDLNTYETGWTVNISNGADMFKTGFTLTSWNTMSDGSGTSYTPGGTLIMGSDNITLFAQWTTIPKAFLHYDGNGSTGGALPASSIEYYQYETITVLGNIYSLIKLQDGILLRFKNWNTSSDGSGTTYTAGSTIYMGTTDVTLYAQWDVIGGTGPGGGMVFYDKGSYSDSWRYIETMLTDQGADIQWGNSGTFLNATNADLGGGYSNAELSATITTNASGLCWFLSSGGKDDWFLPNKVEITTLRNALYVSGLMTNFSSDYYWTSEEVGGTYSWGYLISSNSTLSSVKVSEFSVRAIRKF